MQSYYFFPRCTNFGVYKIFYVYVNNEGVPHDTPSRDEKQVPLYQIDILIRGFLAFYCNLKITGIVNFTRTESPFCIPAVQLGMLRMTRIASTSNN